MRTLSGDLANHKDRRSILKLLRRSKSVLNGSAAFDELQETVVDEFGEYSADSVQFHACRSCKRISECADGTAKDLLEQTRVILTTAKEQAKRKFDHELLIQLEDVHFDLEYLEVVWLEKQCHFNQDIFHSKLSADFCSRDPGRLEALLKHCEGSLRSARVHYWLWVCQKVKTTTRLCEAQRILDQTPDVQALCKLDIPQLKGLMGEAWEQLHTRS